ncbi:unnamed protein product [Ceratitis capitata]|uniref:(Mediterranean fruit fly) hypothetical protein n=1 Tax=Ceratitis capitata TaxID=7213 RepID=A0A811V3C0_CERCA|nr:unnamed protein product [Ceratitis capitata]
MSTIMLTIFLLITVFVCAMAIVRHACVHECVRMHVNDASADDDDNGGENVDTRHCRDAVAKLISSQLPMLMKNSFRFPITTKWEGLQYNFALLRSHN